MAKKFNTDADFMAWTWQCILSILSLICLGITQKYKENEGIDKDKYRIILHFLDILTRVSNTSCFNKWPSYLRSWWRLISLSQPRPLGVWGTAILHGNCRIHMSYIYLSTIPRLLPCFTLCCMLSTSPGGWEEDVHGEEFKGQVWKYIPMARTHSHGST